MTAENFTNVLTVMTERRPFEVFTIVLNDGKQMEVDSPLAIAYRGGRTAFFLGPMRVPTLFDHERVVRVVADRSEVVTDA
ncbi:MAG: hypothetical protein ACRC33_30595 [Gemmataceae bacterium]